MASQGSKSDFTSAILEHKKALLACCHNSVKPNEASIPEGSEVEVGLDKCFELLKQFFSKYKLDEEVGQGHFGYTFSNEAKKGEMNREEVAVKVTPKTKMTTAIAIEDVRRKGRTSSALIGHQVICRALEGRVGKAYGGCDIGIRKVIMMEWLIAWRWLIVNAR